MIELKIRIKSPMLSIRNGLIPETHSSFAPGKNEESETYGIRRTANNIACTVSPTSIIGWIRCGVTEYLIKSGISPCHPYDVNLPTKDYRDYVKQDLEHGYHRKVLNKGEHKGKPECEAKIGEKCIVGEIFGTFNSNHRVFSLLPIKVSPVNAHYEKGLRNITGKGNFLNTSISPRSIVDGTPYATHQMNSISNLDAILYIRMYEPNPRMDVHVALLLKALEYLNEKNSDFNHQLGGMRTFGCGFIENKALPLDLEKREVVSYHNYLMKNEDGNNESTLTKTIQSKIEKWEEKKATYNEVLEEELQRQRELFGIDKKWWETE